MMRQRQKKLLCSLLSGTVLLGLSNAALAEGTNPTFEMDEFVVTASRMPTKIAETAADITVVRREEIEKKNLKTVEEALVRSGIKVEAETGGVSRIMLNGSDQVVVLVDGRRINWEQQVTNGDGGYTLSMLPSLDSVERIEVVRGTASSLYGSSGVGGVVNIITRKGTEQRTTATTEFGSWNSRRNSLQTSGKSGDTGYMVTAERWTQGNYEYKDPAIGKVVTMPDSNLRRETASVRIDKDLSKDRTLTFYFDHLSEYAGYPVAKPGFPFYSPNASRQTVQNNVALSYQWKQGEAVTNNLKLYHDYFHSLWYRYKYNTDSSTRDDEADGIEWNQTRQLNGRHTLLGGLDWRNAHVNVPESHLTQDHTRNVGLFLEDQWKFDSAWTLHAGLRRDEHNVYGGSSTARLSLNRKVNDATNVYLSWGQVYHAPNVDDLFQPTLSYPGAPGGGYYTFSGNPNLKPERGQISTLGVNTKLTDGTAIQVNLFSTYLKDAIKWNTTYTTPVPGVTDVLYEAVNVSRQKKQGLDIDITHPLSPKWDVTAGYSYLQKQEDNNDGAGYQDDISNSNPNSYRLGINYHQNAWNVNVLARGATGRSLDAFTSRQYWIVDVAAGYQMNPNTKVYAKVYNLTNRAYETDCGSSVGGVGSQPMTSRQFVIGLERRL